MSKDQTFVIDLQNLDSGDVDKVGGKNASLGEMISALKKEHIRVPEGFATTAEAFRRFIKNNALEEKISTQLKALKNGDQSLEKTGKSIRDFILSASFSPEFEEEIRKHYKTLCRKSGQEMADVAARSSATAEDLPTASFAGQQETFLNIRGESDLIKACQKCFASLYTDRAISYREEKGFDHLKIALSVGVQKMVRSDQAGSGVMFSLDTETGFPDVIVINAGWGLGENIVQGSINPDEYRTFKPLLDEKEYQPIIKKQLGEKEKKMIYKSGGSETVKNVDTSTKERNAFVLNDEEILQLSRWAQAIEAHYNKPMDMEWAKDGQSGNLFILQARPETVQSQKEAATLKTYSLKEKGEKLLTGLSIGEAIAVGKARVIKSTDEIDQFEENSILVTGMTDPDWVPIMKKAAGIITDYGGRTSHAAIVSRELSIPAVVGTENATERLSGGEEITLSCAEGETGYVYKGRLEYDTQNIDLEKIPETNTRIMMNTASPDAAFRWWPLPNKGVGLARMEFIINNVIKIHPMALLRYHELEDKAVKEKISDMTRGYDDLPQYFIDHLARGMGKIAAAQYPDPVVVRMSDFKTNEYADLIGGHLFEPEEDNPMLGFRGASRYYHDRYRKAFALECKAIKKAREEMGFKNVIVMIPFCRTPEEGDRVIEEMADNGLKRGDAETDLKIYVMCEIPSNIILAKEFAKRFDGFSIGSNDLTQLILGIDRDSALLSDLFDEKNQAVKNSIRQLIEWAHQANRPVGICGQAPSDYPEFAKFLIREGIDSISLNPDSVIKVKKQAAKIESQ